MSSQNAAIRGETQQTKSPKDDGLIMNLCSEDTHKHHKRSFATIFTENLLREIDRNINKEDALHKRLMSLKDTEEDWEFVEKSGKEAEEEDDGFVVVPAAKIRKTKTYTSNLAKAGQKAGK